GLFGAKTGVFRGFGGGLSRTRARNRPPGGPLGGADFAESAGARRGLSSAVRPPRLFFGPARSGAGPQWDRLFFLGRQVGAASIGAAQRVTAIAFWGIYTYKNTYWRLKGSNAQKTHHHCRCGRL